MEVKFDKYSLIIDGKRELIKSAAMHYFRNPGEDTWKDRLLKFKNCGYNTVDIYIPWGFHSLKKGEYDFSGIRDLARLFQVIEEVGLYVIARPGPYINAELSAGGFPKWLLSENVTLRNRKDGDAQHCPKYMEFVKEWYGQVIPIINNCKNVIAFQIENEYATNEGDTQYMKELYQMARNMGVKVPLTHNDMLSAGLYADVVDIYAFDVYPSINMDFDWRNFSGSFGVLDYAEDNLKEFAPESPLYIAELQSGWFDRLGGEGLEKVRNMLKREHINIVTKTALSQGITMFNHFMGSGGTSWGELASAEVYTSYDFAAPIHENGLPQDNYFKAKQINYLLDAYNFASTDVEKSTDDIIKNGEENNFFAKLRKDNINDSKWLFVRNLNKDEMDVELSCSRKLSLKPIDMRILPCSLKINAGMIDFSSYEIFGKVNHNEKEVMIMLIEDKANIELSKFDDYEIKGCIKAENNEKLILSEAKDFDSCILKEGSKETEIIFITEKTADKTWIIDNKIISGVDFISDSSSYAFEKTSNVKEYDGLWHEKKYDVSIDIQAPKLELLEIKAVSPQIDEKFDYSNWQKVGDKLDCLSNHISDEFIWYKGSYDGVLDKIELNARHSYAVYINAKQVFSHDSYCYNHGAEEEETIEIQLDNSIQKDKNEITILCQNVGFDKGFENSPANTRGILDIQIQPEKNIDWRIKGGFDINQKTESINQYFKCLKYNLKVNNSKDYYSPIYLSFKDDSINKANIYLNKVLIGHYWKEKGPQVHFYMLKEFLKSNNVLEIVVWDRENEPQQIGGFNFDKKNVIIIIENFKPHKLVKINQKD